MREWLQIVGWLACVVYSTIPLFWLMIHPFAERWRRTPVAVSSAGAALDGDVAGDGAGHLALAKLGLYSSDWTWIPAALLFAVGLFIYLRSGKNFSAKQLGGLPEVHGGNREQRLVTDGIRARVRHPVYLAHLCEMLAWSVGTGLAVCWGLTAFALAPER